VKEIEQAAGFPGLKKPSNLLATFSAFFQYSFFFAKCIGI
jgi:hypothetical protein